MTDHELKIYPEYFDAILYHFKRFEVRADDRGFQVGDRIILREWDGAEYTGRHIKGRITYILPADEFPDGIREGYAVFAFDVEIFTEGSE